MFERLSTESQRVVFLTLQEAQELHHTHLGTEHLLLGLLRYEEITGPLLGTRPLADRAAARAEVIKPCPVGDSDKEPGDIPFTPRMRGIFEIIDRHTATLPGRGIEPRHLLYGLLTEGRGTNCRGVGFQVLRDLGADIAALTAQAAV